jgi:adenine/guanine/hypoxanthine permease
VAVLGDHPEVTAPALIIVGVMMARGLGGIDWNEMEFAIPAFITVIAMPLTYNIANGIALGLFLFPLMMLFKGRGREVHPALYALAVVFAAYFIWFASSRHAARIPDTGARGRSSPTTVRP